jgi:hypothetical protein
MVERAIGLVEGFGQNDPVVAERRQLDDDEVHERRVVTEFGGPLSERPSWTVVLPAPTR